MHCERFFSLKPEELGYRPTAATYMVGILGQMACSFQAKVCMTTWCHPSAQLILGMLFQCPFYRREEPGRVEPSSGPAKVLTYPSLTPSLFSF